MAEPEVRISNAPEPAADIEMEGGDEIPETGAADVQGEGETEPVQERAPRQTFVEYGATSSMQTMPIAPDLTDCFLAT